MKYNLRGTFTQNQTLLILLYITSLKLLWHSPRYTSNKKSRNYSWRLSRFFRGGSEFQISISSNHNTEKRIFLWVTNLFCFLKDWARRPGERGPSVCRASVRCFKSSTKVRSVILSKFIKNSNIGKIKYIKIEKNLANAITLASSNEFLLSAVREVHSAAGKVIDIALCRFGGRICAAVP